MKTCFAILCIALTGCGTLPRVNVNQLLDRALPPTFRGDARIAHDNPYSDFTITATNLRRNYQGEWEFDRLEYSRRGRVSHGTITLGKDATGRP